MKFAVSPPNKPGETNGKNKIKKQRRVKPAGTKAEANHIKLSFARKNWEEAINPAAALARTKKAKEGAYVSTGAHVPQGEKKAIVEDAANRLFECRDDDNVAESILHGRECTPKASKLLFSDTGSCYYGTNDKMVIAEDWTIYTAVTPTGLSKGIAAISAGPPLKKYSERNDVTKWTEETRALVATACYWVAGAFDRSGGAGDDNRSPCASAPVAVPNGIRLIDSDAVEWTEADSFRENNGDYSAGAIKLGVKKPAEAPRPFPFDPCCGAHVLSPTCGRKSDNSVHPCDNSKSGSSKKTGGTGLSADAIEWTATDFVKVDNDCDNLARKTELEGHRLLSIWMRRLKNRAARELQPAKQHPQPQYSPGEKDDDNTRSCNTNLPFSQTTKGNRVIDSDAFGLTRADLVTSKINGDGTVCCAVPSEVLGKSHGYNRRLKNNAVREPQPAKHHPQPQCSPGEKNYDNSRSSNTFLPVSHTSNGNRLIDSDAFGSNRADLVTSKINGDETVCCAVPSEALEKSHGHYASSARNKHQLHDASQLTEASQIPDTSQLVGYDEKSLVNLSLTKNDTALSDDTSDLMIRIKSALETAQASDQIPSSTLLRKRTVTSDMSSVLRSKTEASSTFSS